MFRLFLHIFCFAFELLHLFLLVCFTLFFPRHLLHVLIYSLLFLATYIYFINIDIYYTIIIEDNPRTSFLVFSPRHVSLA